MRLCILLLLFTLLSGCSYFSSHHVFENRNKHYLKEQSIPPLRIPPGISSDAFNNEYPVSSRQYSHAATDVSIKPPGLS
ncbi:MAG TPA: hypothetical protein VNC84_04415 [Gammaproteobacteria bacterium]|jgi:uncharacterized lipoprotein|nr:hypothetical protein [Gammaproteobacteria bacterium]